MVILDLNWLSYATAWLSMKLDRKYVLNIQRYSASQIYIVDHVTLTENKYLLSSTMFVLFALIAFLK